MKYSKEIGENERDEHIREMIEMLTNGHESIPLSAFKRICKTKIK